MGGANSVDRPGMTHSTSIANTYADPIVRSNIPPLNGELVAEDAITNIREVSSAPSKVDEHRGYATTFWRPFILRTNMATNPRRSRYVTERTNLNKNW